VRRGGIELTDRTQHFAPIAEHDAKVFQVLIGQVAKDRDVDATFGKFREILGQAEPFEPLRDLLHQYLQTA
jgi:hypothetical protein